MKKLSLFLLAVALLSGALLMFRTRAAEELSLRTTEFATIRWDGREHSFLVRPNAKVEKLRPLFDRYPRPEGIDERIYYMTIAMNAVAKEGFKFAGSLDGQVVMKRVLAH